MEFEAVSLALFGLVALLVVGAILYHIHVRKQSRILVESIHASLQGRAVERREGHFAEVLAAVDEVTGEISRLRQKARVHRRITEISDISDVGVVVTTRGLGFRFGTRVALDLFQIGSDGGDWSFVRDLLEPHVQPGMHGETIDIEIPGHSVRCQVHTLPEREGYLLLFRDDSIIRSLEIDLRVAAYSRGLARLYAGVAHDFKAPLSALLLNLELLKASIDGEVESDRERDEQKRWVRVVEEEIGRLRRAFDSLLSFTAPPKDDKHTFDMRELVEDIEALLGPQARQQRVEINANVPDHPLLVSGHRDRIKQALLSVAINAIEVMPDGGKLAIDLGRYGKLVALGIADTGPGIAEDIRERIFSMHFTTKQTGTGIGLYVSRSILDEEGGSLDLVASSSEGTRFEARLPLSE